MNTPHQTTRPALMRSVTLAAAVAMALGLAACGKNDDRTAGQKLDSAIAQTEQAAQEAKVRTQEAAHDARVAVQDAAQDAKVTMQDAAQDAKARADAAAAEARADTHAVAQETREKVQEAKAETHDAAANAKAAVTDVGITAKVNAGLAKDPDLSAVRIDVDTKGGAVTLTGPVKSEQARERATQIARGVDGVTRVENHLEIRPGA